MRNLLAIDQGTTSSRAIIFSEAGAILATAQKEFRQIFPKPGWVEHDAEEIWSTTVEVTREVVEKVGDVVALGITNQRETAVMWDRATGEPIANAIVWQDRRTAGVCQGLRDGGHLATVTAKTGLLLDPYFSGTKITWLLDNVDGARARAKNGELAFGTIDTFLIWRLTGGKVHATDATNASRTLLFDLEKQDWDEDMLELFSVPRSVLPEVKNSADDFGVTKKELLGSEIPIHGVAGDQQAALVGQACFTTGMTKSTYGTGCFALTNTGDQLLKSEHKLLTTMAYRLNGKPTFALEGSIFIAGAAVQWLRDSLGVVQSSAETEDLAKSLPDNRGVYLVPAFTGLGAPHWDADARGAIFGITRETGPAELARATLESLTYQTHDLFEAMARDGIAPTTIRVDGGAAKNDWLMQFLADMLGIPVERPTNVETTAMGAAFLAGLGAGIYPDLETAAATWKSDAIFKPAMTDDVRSQLLEGWQDAVRRVVG
ncbi:MAG: glycerol kinase GlpK [Verrucomicrobiota bacterium]